MKANRKRTIGPNRRFSTADSELLGFSLERLEQRFQLAGNVAASLAGGVLSLTGDNLGNSVQVLLVAATNETEDDKVTVEGIDGTLIQAPGEAPADIVEFTVDAAGLDDIRATLKGGDDDLSIGPRSSDLDSAFAINRDIQVKTGSGHDVVEIHAQVGRDVVINTSSGNDVAVVEGSVVGRSVNIKLGGGDLDGPPVDIGSDLEIFQQGVGIVDSQITTDVKIIGGNTDDIVILGEGETSIDGHLTLNTKSGNDTVLLWSELRIGSEGTKLKITTGGGDDSVGLDQIQVDANTTIKTANGNDVVAVETSLLSDFTVNTGGGDDDVIMDGNGFDVFTGSPGNTVSGRTKITTGGGSDYVYVREEHFSGPFDVNAGGGNDFLYVEMSTFEIAPIARGGGGFDLEEFFSNTLPPGTTFTTIGIEATGTPLDFWDRFGAAVERVKLDL